MASSSLNVYHTRSNSFPSKSHPVSSNVEECLSRLRSSEATSTSSSTIVKDLDTLQDLYNGINCFLQLPLTQQALSQDQNKSFVNQVLDGSIKLLDVCNIAKDALLQTTESLHELQSIMRRKRVAEACFTSEVKKYTTSRKSFNKVFNKLSKNLKKDSNKTCITSDTFILLKEAEAVTIDSFASILSFYSGSKASNNWSLVSKLMKSKRVACEEHQATANEFTRVDVALQSLISGKSDIDIESVQNDMQCLESCIQDLEQGLDCIFKCLIKFRVSALNFLD